MAFFFPRTTTNLLTFGDISVSGINIVNSGIGLSFVDTSGAFVMSVDGASRTVTVQNLVVLGSGTPSYTSFAVDPGLDGYTFSLSGTGSNMWYNTGNSSISFRVASSAPVMWIQTSGVSATRMFLNPGLISAPAYSFIGGTSAGMYLSGSTIGLTTNGTSAIEFNSSDCVIGAYSVDIGRALTTGPHPGTSKISISADSTGTILTTLFRTLTSFYVFSNTIGGSVFKLDDTGNVVLGEEKTLSTVSTAGFAYIPTSSGKITTLPATTYTGKTPMFYDGTNGLFNLYSGSAWTQVKPGYWHSEGNYADSRTFFPGAGVPGIFTGSTYYNMSLDGDLLNMYVRLRWTTKTTGTGVATTLLDLTTIPYTFPSVTPYVTCIPVQIGYKEGMAFSTQIAAIASIENIFGGTYMFVRYYMYSQTSTNPPVAIETSNVANDGAMTLSLSYPLNTLKDPFPITGF